MTHRRFFINPETIVKDKVSIREKDTIHHILKVLRLKEKDTISVLDGLGNEYNVVITSTAQDRIMGEIVEKITHPATKIELTLVQALPKITKMDFVISKCTELGIRRIIPVKTQRSVVNLKDESTKFARWKRIAKSSSAQSQRAEIPIIHPITNLTTSLELIKEIDLGLILYEKAKGLLRDVFNRNIKFKKIAIFVGPEGGFTHQEITEVEAKGIIAVSLGHNILRCETAPIVACSIILYELGMIG
ncbi:MAG: RsmE family RNA methyltransferase [bacterium]